MKKNIIYLCIILICLSGCSKETDNSEKGTESGLEASDVEYIDEWDFSQSSDNQAKSWEVACDNIILDISNIEWVESTSIEPLSYEEYIAEGKITITCSVNDDAPDESDIREVLEGYLDAANVITNYELIIID